MYVRGKRSQKASTHSSSALQQRRTDGRRHTRETTETGACDYTARSWKGKRNEKGKKFWKGRRNEKGEGGGGGSAGGVGGGNTTSLKS